MDRMPDITMPEVEKSELDDVPEEVKEELAEMATEDLEVEQEDTEAQEMPKPKIDNNEVFRRTTKASKEEQPLKVIGVKKPKKPLSEEHLARLAKGRATALANRRAKAKEREEKKAQKKAMREASPEPVLKSVEPEQINNQPKIVERVIEKGPTQEDIESLVAKASQKAVENYEFLRKERKAKKAQAQKEEKERQNIRQTIQRATTAGIDPNNPWANCY